MKKLYLLFIMVLVLTACGQQQDTNPQNNQNQEKKQVNQTPVGGPNQKVLEAVNKIKDVKECDSKFTKKKDIITCKMEYIVQNIDKLDEKVCKNIEDKVSQKDCKNIFVDKKIREIADKLKDIKECDKLFKKKEYLLSCKINYIIKNADKLNEKVCENIEDEVKQKDCKNIFLDKKIKEIAVKKIKDVKECDSKFTKKENIITCKMEYIIQNADKLNLKVCKNIEDINEQQVCKSFFKNK